MVVSSRASLNVAVTAVETLTPVAPDIGVFPVTVGGVMSGAYVTIKVPAVAPINAYLMPLIVWIVKLAGLPLTLMLLMGTVFEIAGTITWRPFAPAAGVTEKLRVVPFQETLL
jgi:hypothetical protein